jgi:pimeloyl-ACP methyl ester carboxylesterase
MRSGAIAALAQDLADFIDRLELIDVLVAGYDWGARAGYAVAALYPERLYEWFVVTKRGREAMETDRRRLCRYLWET